MRIQPVLLCPVLALLLLSPAPAAAKPIPASAEVLYETTTNYHHIAVYDHAGIRTLSFDGSEETIMKLAEPVYSGFEYLNFFHAPFAFNGQITDVLMIGLGGGSAAKQFQSSYPEVNLDIVELDPVVVKVAEDFFSFTPGPHTRVVVNDGRRYLASTKKQYDLILMDAYTSNPYGSFIPFHLATEEFFALAKSRLRPGGMIGYNVIGQLSGWRKDIMGSLYKTMETSFPNIYMFPADSSRNVVMIGDSSVGEFTKPMVVNGARSIVNRGRTKLPSFLVAVNKMLDADAVPPTYQASPILRDDYAPVDGLVQ